MPETLPYDIRPATPTDLPAVASLIAELARFEKLPGPDAAATQRLATDFAAGRFQLLVAERASRLVGYALYFFTYSTFLARPSLYLEDLFVEDAARGGGIGEALLRRLAQTAHESGCGRFEWTVLDWNVNAQRFYERMGARMLPEWRICRVDGEPLTALGRPRT